MVPFARCSASYLSGAYLEDHLEKMYALLHIPKVTVRSTMVYLGVRPLLVSPTPSILSVSTSESSPSRVNGLPGYVMAASLFLNKGVKTVEYVFLQISRCFYYEIKAHFSGLWGRSCVKKEIWTQKKILVCCTCKLQTTNSPLRPLDVLAVCLFVCLSVSLSVCLSVFLSLSLS